MKKSSQNLKTKVSVIIVNYNTGKLLKECVISIVKTTNSLNNPRCEIIVIDNNSTDGSESFQGNFTLIKNSDNPGFARANNQGIKKAKGEFILLLNPDTKIHGNAIEKLVDFARSNPDAGIVAPRLLNADGSTQDSVMPFPTVFRAIQEFWLGNRVYSKYVPMQEKPVVIEAAVMAAFLITPQASKKVGLLDERYFMYFEDLDYCRKVRASGLKVYYLPSALITHYQGVSGKNLTDANNQWKRLIPSSKIYNGLLSHYIINFVIWISRKLK